MHLQLYLFSGTGNARNVAEWLKIAATRKNWSVESFIFRFPPANKANKVFIINTRAG